jgi:hypothetical protein
MADEMNPEQPQSQQGLSQAYLDSVMARKQEAERQMQKLMDALNVRKNMPFDPVMMRMAGALLAPTKTGSFGESAGYAATAAADETEKQAMRGIDFAKLEFELGQKKLEQQKGMDALKLRQQFFGGKPAAAAPVAAQPLTDVPQASTPEAPAMSPEAMPPVAPPSMVSAAPPAAPASYQRQMPTGMDALLMMESDPELYKLLSEEDKRRLEEAKFGLEQRKTEATERVTVESGGVKISMPLVDYNRMTDAIEKGDFDTAKKYYTKHGLDFPFVKDDKGWRRKTASEAAEDIEIAKGIEPKLYPIPEVRGEVKMLPKDYRAYRKAVDEGKGQEWVDKNILRKGTAGTEKAEERAIVTEEERVAEQKRRERKAEEQAKSEVKSRDEYISNAKTAMIIEKPANQIFKIASDPIKSKALGLLENPDVFSAVAGVTADGVRVGPFSVGIPAIRDAVAKVTNDPKEREQILDALQMLNRNYSEIELNFTRLYLKGEGAVTEGERAIVRQVSGGVGNRRTVALAQTETLLQRTAFDKAVKTELLRWEKANPNKSIDEFTESAGYKKLYNDLERNTDAIYDKYFGGKKEPKAEPKATESKAPAPSGSVRDRIDAAKKARGLQ